MFLKNILVFVKSLFAAQTIEPEIIGFSGITLETVGNFFTLAFTIICEIIYALVKWLLAIVDFLQYFIQKLIGLDYWLKPGSKTIQGATDNDILFQFLYNDTVQNVFRAMVGVFIILTIVFVIFAIVKTEWKYATGDGKGGNSKMQIFRSSFKSLILVIVFPLVLTLGIISSNAILASLVGALNLNMAQTFGGTLFSIAAESANKYRIYSSNDDKAPVSQQVTFYVENSTGKTILFSNGSQYPGDKYCTYIADYGEYLATIYGKTGSGADRCSKYTVDTVFDILVPRKEKNFSGYCVGLQVDGSTKYFLVKCAYGEKDGYYYYLRNILNGKVLSKNQTINSSQGMTGSTVDSLRSDLKDYMEDTGKQSFMSGVSLHSFGSGDVIDAAYNTWGYASVYTQKHTFESAQSFGMVYGDVLNDLGLSSISNAKVSFNSNAVSPYFDNGQFGYVSKQAEYKVMADIVDFICNNNADLYMIDVTSSMVKWDHGEYIPESRFVGGGTDHKVNLSEGANSAQVNPDLADDVLPFIVSYSDLCNDADMGNQLYLARYNKSSELEGAVYVMCWKIIEGGKTRYVPLVNGKGYYNETTGVEFPTFKSEFYSNGYRGLVVAKGLLNNETTNQSYGEPTYIASGVKNLNGVEGLESPYYYELSVNSELYQYAKSIKAKSSYNGSGDGLYEISDIIASGISATLSSDDYAGGGKYYELISTSDGATAMGTDPTIVANMTIYLRNRTDSTVKTAKYAGLTMNFSDTSHAADLNNGGKYLFVTSDGGYFVLSATKATDFSTGYFIHEITGYSSGQATVGERQNEFFDIMYLRTDLMSYYYKDSSHKGEKVIAGDPSDDTKGIALNMLESTTAKYDGKSVFRTIDMYYVDLDSEIDFTKTMYMNLSFNTSGSSIFSYVDSDNNKFRVAEPVSISGTDRPTAEQQKQMQCTVFFDVNYYDFLTGYVDGTLRRYDITQDDDDDALSDAADTIDPVLTETYGVNTTGFAWDAAAVSYDLYDGDRYVATIYKPANTTCSTISDLITTSSYIMIEYTSYYNIRTQNNYSSESAFTEHGKSLRNSFVVGFNRDSLKSRSFIFDFRISLLGKGRLKLVMSSYEVEKDVQKGFLYTSDSLAFDYFFDGEGTVSGNKIELRTFYVPTKVANPFGVGFWIMCISAALIIKILGTALWGIIKRFYEITLYYIAMPAVASTIVLDDGKRFQQSIQTPLISKVLSTYGVILGINAFFVLLAPVKSMSNVFTASDIATSGSYFLKALSNLPLFGSYELTAKLLNAYTYILFLLVAFTMINELPGLITRIMGTGKDGGDVLASGKQTKDAVKKTMVDAGKTMSGQGLLEGAQQVGQTALGMIPGSALAQAGAQKLGGLFKGKGGGGGGSKRDGEDGGGDEDGAADQGAEFGGGKPGEAPGPQEGGGQQGGGDGGDGGENGGLLENALPIDGGDSARDNPMEMLGEEEGIIDAIGGGLGESIAGEVGGELVGEIGGEIGGQILNQGIDLVAGDGASDMLNGATSMLGALEGGGVDQILEHTMDLGVTDLSDGISGITDVAGNIGNISDGISNVADMAGNVGDLTEGVSNLTDVASTIEDGASSAGLSLVTGIAGNAVGGIAEDMVTKMGGDEHVADIVGDTLDGFTTDAINGAILTSEGGPTAIAGAVAGGLEGAARKGAESLVENGVEVAVEKTGEAVSAVAEGVSDVVDGVQGAVEGAGEAVNNVAQGVGETVENVASEVGEQAADMVGDKAGEKAGEKAGDKAGAPGDKAGAPGEEAGTGPDGKKKGLVEEAKEISEKQKAAVKGFFGMVGGGIMTGLTATGKGLKKFGGIVATPFVAAGKGVAKAAKAVYGKVLTPIGEGAKKLAGKAKDGVSFLAGKVKDGAQWVGGKVVGGAKAVAGGAKWLGGKVVGGAQWVGNKVADGAKWVGRTAKAGFNKAKDGVVAAASAVYGKVLKPIGQGAVKLAGKAKDGVSFLAGKVKDGAQWVGGKVVSGAKAVAGGAKWVGNKFVSGAQWVGRTAKAGFNKAKDGVVAAASAVYGKVLKPIGQGAAKLAGKAKDGVSFLAGKVKDGAHWVGGKVVGGAKAVAGGAKWVGNKVASGAKWVGRTAKAGFNKAKDGVLTAANAVYGKVLKPIGDGAKKVAEKAKAGASYIAGKVKDGAHWVGGKARTVAKYGLATAMTIASPFKAAGKAVYNKVLKPAGQGIAKAAKATYGAVLKPIGQGAKKVAEKAKEGVSYLGGKVKDGVHWAGGKAVSAANWVKQGAPGLGKKLKEGAQWVGDKATAAAGWVKQHGGAIKKVAKTAAVVGMVGLAMTNPMAALTVGAGFVAAKAAKNVAVSVYGNVLKPIGQGAVNIAKKAKEGVSYVVGGVKTGVANVKDFAQKHEVGKKAGKFARGALAAGLIGFGLTSPAGLLGVAAGVTVARGVRRTGRDIAGLTQKAYGGIMDRVNAKKEGKSITEKIAENGSYVKPATGKASDASSSAQTGKIEAQAMAPANEAAAKVAEKGESYVKQQAEQAQQEAPAKVESAAEKKINEAMDKGTSFVNNDKAPVVPAGTSEEIAARNKEKPIKEMSEAETSARGTLAEATNAYNAAKDDRKAKEKVVADKEAEKNAVQKDIDKNDKQRRKLEKQLDYDGKTNETPEEKAARTAKNAQIESQISTLNGEKSQLEAKKSTLGATEADKKAVEDAKAKEAGAKTVKTEAKQALKTVISDEKEAEKQAAKEAAAAEKAERAPFVPAKGKGKKAAAEMFNGELNAAGKTEGFVPTADGSDASQTTTSKAARKRAKGEEAYLSFDANVPSEKTAKNRYNLDKINDPAVVADKDAALANIVRNQSDTEVGLAVSLRSIARYGGRGTQNRSIGAQIYAGINGGETQEGLLTAGMKEQLIVSTFNKPKSELYGSMSNEDRQKVLDSYQVVGGLRTGGGLHGSFGFEVRGKDGRQFANNAVTADVLGQMMSSEKITKENINKSAGELGLTKNLEAQLAKNLALGVDYSSDLSKTENMTDSKVYRTATTSKKHGDVVAQGILNHITADPESDVFKNASKDLGISSPKDLENPAVKERVVDQISRMKNSEGKNSINTIPESDYSGNLASVMKDKARSGEFNVTAWDYASAETKANEVANVEAMKDGTVREDLAAAEKRLSRQAVHADESKVLLNTFATAKVEDKSTIVNGMISSGKFVNTSAEDGKRLQGVVAGIKDDDTSENAQLVKSAGDDQLMLAMKKGVMLSDIGTDRAGLNVDVLAKYLKGSEDIDTALIQNIARRGMNNGSVKSAVGVLESSLTSDQRSSMLDSAANQGTLGLTVGENRNLKRMLKDTDVDVNKLSYFEAKSVLAGATTDQIAVEVEHEAKVDKATNKLVETQGNLISNDAVKAELEKGGDNQATTSMFASNYSDKMSMLNGSEKDGIKLNAAKSEIEKYNAENADNKVELAENASLADVAKAVKGNAGLSAKIDVAGLDAVDAENKQRLAMGMGERLKMYAADVQGDQSLYNKARSAFRTGNPGKDLDEADSMVRNNYLANEFVNSLSETDKNMVNARRGEIDLDYISKMTGMSREDAKALQKEANESGKSIDSMMIEKGKVKTVAADKVDTEIIKKMETGEFVELHNEAKRENYNEEIHGVNKVKYNILRNSPNATPAVDVDSMDYEQKSRYEFTRNLFQQMNRTGENPNMLANTFRNTNLYDNDRVVEEMAAIKIDGQDAINPKLSVAEKKKRLSNEQINAYLGSHEEYKEILTSYAAADVTRTLDDSTKEKNLSKIAKQNPELSAKVNQEIKAQGKQPYQTSAEDYNKILQQLMQKDEAFKNAMYSKLTDAFDPGAKLSHAERIMFFENNKAVEKETNGNTMKSINEWLSKYIATDGKDTGNILLNKKQNLPENSAVYDNWNKYIDSKIGEIQSKKGQYADMTGDQRKAEVSKLQSKYIKPVNVDGLSDEELETQVKQQEKNKQDAFAVGDFTELYSKGARVNKINSKNVRAVIAKNGFDSNGEFDVLTGKRITTDVEEKHKADLAAAINNETRYKAASKMRTSSDFGENFNAMAVSYLGQKSAKEVNDEATARFLRMNKGKATKTGILNENFKYEDLTPAQQKELQTERRYTLERQLGNNVARASMNVSYDRQMKEYDSWMQSKGLMAEIVRYTSGTQKFTKQQSKTTQSGVVAPKAAAKIRANQTEYLSTTNDRKAVEEFNRSYRGSKTQYANEVRQRVTGDSSKKALEQLLASRDISGKKFTDNTVSVQKAEIEKMLANLSNKAENRLNSSYKYIPSPARPYVGASFSLGVNKKERELQISKLSDYRSALDSIAKGKGKVSYDSLFNNLNSSVQNSFKNSMSSKARTEFNGKSDAAKYAQLEQYLLKNYNKLSNHVKVNNFYHANTSALTNMNGVSVKRSVTSAETRDIMKSLKPGEATRYNDILHRRETEVVKYNKEEQHYSALSQKLSTTKDVKEQKVIRKQMSDSATKLTTYQKTIQEIDKEKRVFEQKIESRRSAGDVRVGGGLGYNKSRNILDDYGFRTKGVNGQPGKPVHKGGPLDRPMNLAILRFMERYKNQMQQIVKTEIYNSNTVLKQYTRGKVNKLTNDLSRTIADNRQLRKFMTSELRRLEGSMDEKDLAVKNALSNDIDRLTNAEQALKADLQGLGIELSSMEKLVDNANKNATKPISKK